MTKEMYTANLFCWELGELLSQWLMIKDEIAKKEEGEEKWLPCNDCSSV